MVKKKYNPLSFLIQLIFVSLVFFSGLFTHHAVAQDKKVQKGIEKYEFNAYKDAIELFKKALDEDNKNNTALRYLANSYRKTKDYQNAELYYALLVNSDSVIAEDYFYYGQALRANRKVIEAKEQFAKFESKTDNKFLASLIIQSFEEIYKWEMEGSKYLSFYDADINTRFSEFNLVPFNGRYYLTSNRLENFTSPESFGWDGSSFLSILEIDSALLFTVEPEFTLVPGKLNSDYHDGPLTINKAKNKVIITRVENRLAGKGYTNNMKLFEGSFIKGKWKNFEAIPFNSNTYSVGHACFADNGDSTIIFSSNMPGGYGGMDLYVSKKINGTWQKPTNLGPVINTQLDEVFPYVKDDELYFASNGHKGYGGLDIFVSKFNQGWNQPINLKSPINSGRDDFGISFISDSTGFYASNRAEGKGGDDVFRFYKSKTIQTVGISGIFEYAGLPVDGAKILLVNSEDSILDIAYTDSTGRFNFSNLRYQEDYLVRVETEDVDLLEDGMLYLTNQDGDKIKLIERLRDGEFKFKALPADEIKIDLLAAEDSDSLPEDPYIRGNVFKMLPGDFKDQLKVYLVNDQGLVIDSTFSDFEGNFKFSKLALDDNRKYIVKLDAIDETYNVALINEYGRIYNVKESDLEKGTFQFVNELDPSRQPVLTSKKGITGIIARLEYNGKPLPYTKVQIFDSGNNLIATIFTNERGEFQYNKLDIDKSYLFTLPDVSDEVLDDASLYVTSIQGDPLYLINKLRDNTFEFRALPFDMYPDIQEMEAAAVPDFIDFGGVVFRKLAGDLDQTLKVYLLDDDGNIIDSMMTDPRGRFNFQKLPSDKTYAFKVDEPEDLTLSLYNDYNKIVEQTLLDEKGNFVYKKLTYMVAQFDPVKAVDLTSTTYEEIDVEVYAQVFRKLPGDYEEGMKVIAYDEQGNVVGEAYTDKDGKFRFKKLKPEETYIFKIVGEDGNYQIITLDKEGNVLSKIIKNNNGEFEYKTLPIDKYKAVMLDITDQTGGPTYKKPAPKTQTISVDGENYLIYFRFDSFLLSDEAKTTLDKVLKAFKNNLYSIEVNSHTDIRGPKVYNDTLSKRRTNSVIKYLVENGVNKERVEGNFFGKMMPIIDCKKIKCSREDHAKNRRSEIRFVNKQEIN